MKTIKFLVRVAPYQAGEVAGFSDEDAQRYIDAKAAEAYSPKRTKKTEEEPKDPPVLPEVQ